MTSCTITTKRQAMQQEGIDTAARAPARSHPSERVSSGGRGRAGGLLALLAAAVAACIWSGLRSPWYEEYRYAHESLARLQRERGNRLDNPRLLYHLGRGLN